jgi:predicted alpha/beta superfamily hydrolase
VVYTLDADYSFALAHNIIEHFTDRGDLPQMIVVSIAYEGASQDQTIYRINRVRDYAPTRQQLGGYGAEINKFSGEGVKFAQFLREELIPFIDSNYRTKDKDRTIVGHSLGGLFGTFMLFTQTEVFQRYILVSPSLWWSGYSGLRYEAEYAEKHADLSARVYYGIGGEEESYARPMVSTMEKLVATIEARAYQGLALKSDVLRSENHNSVFPGALVRGLRWVFRGD